MLLTSRCSKAHRALYRHTVLLLYPHLLSRSGESQETGFRSTLTIKKDKNTSCKNTIIIQFLTGLLLLYLVSARKLTIQINNNGLRLIPAKKIRRNLK
jgi:hypothetical protein